MRLSQTRRMTPGIVALKRAGVEFEVHQYSHDPGAESYGREAAEKLGVDPSLVFKTLVIELDSEEAAVAVIPVLGTLDLKSAASALGAKKAKMAEPRLVQRTTGYVLGGVSPVGQRKALRTILDEHAAGLPRIYVSGGKRGLDISLDPKDLLALTRGRVAAVMRPE